jgi:acyl-CoA synthetase (AMP-forming)/AMP-acid ligase II
MAAYSTPLVRIRERAVQAPGEDALMFEGERISNAELDLRSSAVANGLLAERLPEESRIALLDFNDPSFAEVFLGAAKAGHTLCPVNARLAAPEVAWILNDARAPVLLVGRDHYALIESIESQLTKIRKIIAIHGGHDRWMSYEQWRGAQSSVDPMLPVSLDLDIVQLYTSGTTGHPKGVRQTHRTWEACAAAISLSNPSVFAPDSRYLICLPLFHVAGFNPLCFTLTGGGCAVIARRSDPAEIIMLLEKHAITNVLLVPALILAILNSPSRPNKLPSLRKLGYGASPIAQDVLKRAQELFACPFEHLYGMTENFGAVTSLPSEMHDPKFGKLRSCGKPYEKCEVKVVAADGREKQIGEVGEIIMRSAWIMPGYWNQAAATAATIRDGWLWTGDAGYFDADGFLYIHDRVNDMIKTGSENVYPAEVENAIFGHPSIADVAVIGVPDERWDEVIKAVVVLKPGAVLDVPDLEVHLRSRIGGFKIPRSYEVVSSLPRNASGKVLRRQLREQFGAGKSAH